MKNAFGLAQAPLSIYTMAGMIWALSSHYFPLAYLSLGPALRVLDVRMEEAGLVSGGAHLAGADQDHAAAAAARDPVRDADPVRARHVVLRGAAPDRAAGPHRRLHHRHPVRHHPDPAGVRGGERARAHPPDGLHRGGVLLSARHPPCRSLRHHHRQGLHADPDQARGLALAGRDRHRPDVHAGARPAAAHPGVAVVLPQSGAAVHGLGRAVHARQLQIRAELSDLPRRREDQRACWPPWRPPSSAA